MFDVVIFFGACFIILAASAYFKLRTVDVYKGYQTIVQDQYTCQKRALDKGWHNLGISEKTVAINWMWRERKCVNRREGYRIPTKVLRLKPMLMSVRSNCGTDVTICSEMLFQIIEPLKVVEYTQPIEYMLVGTSSIVEKVVGDYKCAELYPLKTKIQERISAEVSDYVKNLGITCKGFVIKHF